MYANVYFASFSLVIFPVSVLLLWMVSPKISAILLWDFLLSRNQMRNCMHLRHLTDEWLLLVVK